MKYKDDDKIVLVNVDINQNRTIILYDNIEPSYSMKAS